VKISCCVSAIFAALLLSIHELPAAEPPNVNADGMTMAEVAGTEAGGDEADGLVSSGISVDGANLGR